MCDVTNYLFSTLLKTQYFPICQVPPGGALAYPRLRTPTIENGTVKDPAGKSLSDIGRKRCFPHNSYSPSADKDGCNNLPGDGVTEMTVNNMEIIDDPLNSSIDNKKIINEPLNSKTETI